MTTILKYIGFIYYTVTSITIFIFLHLFFRLSRRPNPRFYKDNKALSLPIIIFYSLLNLFLCYLFFQKKLFRIYYISLKRINHNIFFILSSFWISRIWYNRPNLFRENIRMRIFKKKIQSSNSKFG